MARTKLGGKKANKCQKGTSGKRKKKIKGMMKREKKCRFTSKNKALRKFKPIDPSDRITALTKNSRGYHFLYMGFPFFSAAYNPKKSQIYSFIHSRDRERSVCKKCNIGVPSSFQEGQKPDKIYISNDLLDDCDYRLSIGKDPTVVDFVKCHLN